MKTRSRHFLAGIFLFTCCAGCLVWLRAQQSPQFTAIRRLTNSEIALTLSAPTGLNYRIDAATNPPAWEGLVTLPTNTTTTLQHTDSAAPYFNTRYYRAVQLAETNVFTGDHLATTNGELIIHPLFHATFVMNWNGTIIYNDPADDAALQSRYLGLPKADLILVSHSHSDHFSASRINSVRGANAVIVAPQAVYNGLSAAQKAITIVLTNGASTKVLGLTIDAIPAYNPTYHPLGTGNGYVLTIGGKRIFISGDTGNIAEMRALSDVDVSFVCMNIPYTMTVNEATNAVSAFRPKVVYPYHYRDQSGAVANANSFKQRLGTDLGIEVRLRKWY